MSRRQGNRQTASLFANKETSPMNASAQKPLARLRRMGLLTALLACLAMLAAAPAQAVYGINGFDVEFTNEDGTAATQAGAHPFAVTTSFEVNNTETGFFDWKLSGATRDAILEQVPGFIGNATAMPRCADLDFLELSSDGLFGLNSTECPNETIVGINAVGVLGPIAWFTVPIYNLTPPPGVAARLGFAVSGVQIVIDVGTSEEPPYNIVVSVPNASQLVRFFGGVAQLWGDPSDPAHDEVRGVCGINTLFPYTIDEVPFKYNLFGPPFVPSSCPVEPLEEPFITNPTACQGPQATHYATRSWQEPDNWDEGSVLTHDDAEPPNPQGFTGCGKLGFSPTVESKPTTEQAETGTGLDFNLDFDDEGLLSTDGLAESHPMKAVVTLPEGMTINPSVGEGLGVCTPADLDRETLKAAPGEGCPNASKVGTLDVDLPIVGEPVEGSIYLAQQDDPTTTTPGAENPFDSLIALYFVIKNTNLGAIAKLPVLVEADPVTGQLVVTLDDAPQFPIGHFNAHLRTGQRSALVTPPTCGTYTTETKLYPWSDPDNPRTVTSSFEISEGVNGGPCPSGGLPPFKPQFEAGSVNNNAGAFSPFNMKLLRSDGEQNMTKFSSVLPPGVLGSLAGVSKCPDAAIEAAKPKTGKEEFASPSCPANSLIGHTLAGAGVGSALTYVKGYVYLGGPYKGRPLSVVSVTPALAGPFDAGTVVVRLALTLNPKTAEVEVDGANSDPIPHILKGIVLKVRDLRVYVDRPNFTLNPTSCDESSARATLFGSYLNVLDSGDDAPVDLSTRYQAANCLNLGFKPKLNLNLKGGTKRGGHPGLSAVYTPRPGDANVEGLVVRLPRSAFLDQAHIKTICTRVQFAADACPERARYGFIRAWTPLLEEPLAGPVWLRSSDHKLPDLVFDLHGLVDVEVATRLDSAKGGIRATVEDAPDAPLSKVVLRMQGAKKGLIINSRDLCARKSRANVEYTGHNGKQSKANPVMRPQCGGKRKAG
jgi:hypothetical protein